MTEGLTATPCAETVAPTPVKPIPTGAILTSSEVSETPETEYEMRHGAKFTAVADSPMPVMALEMRAAPLANLDGAPTSLPAGGEEEERRRGRRKKANKEVSEKKKMKFDFLNIFERQKSALSPPIFLSLEVQEERKKKTYQ